MQRLRKSFVTKRHCTDFSLLFRTRLNFVLLYGPEQSLTSYVKSVLHLHPLCSCLSSHKSVVSEGPRPEGPFSNPQGFCVEFCVGLLYQNYIRFHWECVRRRNHFVEIWPMSWVWSNISGNAPCQCVCSVTGTIIPGQIITADEVGSHGRQDEFDSSNPVT